VVLQPTRFLTAVAPEFQSAGRRELNHYSVKDLAGKLSRYINAYSVNARPIKWKYSDPARRIRINSVSVTRHSRG